MVQDAQGHELLRSNEAAARHIDEAVRAFTLNYGDANAHLAKAEAAAPDCPMVHLLRAWLLTLSNDPVQVGVAAASAAGIDAGRLNEREAGWLEALRLAAGGRWLSAVALLDRHLMRFPKDLAAHQLALRLDGYLGRFHRGGDRSARALPFWSKDEAGYGIMLSFYGFGLEESGEYAKAEEISRAAAELEPYGYWPHHAVSHVMEMTGRPQEGLAWMQEREPLWSAPEHTNRIHIWWHKALFHVELGERDEALALYDGEILEAVRPVGASLCNLTALLWRLETLGCEGGQRWQHQFSVWQDRADGRTSPFNDIHWAMAALRAGETQAFEGLIAAMRETAADGGELSPVYGHVAVPVVEAMARFERGDYAGAVEQLLPVRADLWRMGGSNAQRDLIDWTLTEAALRGRLQDVALSLANERLSHRPNSTVNRHFFDEARAIAA